MRDPSIPMSATDVVLSNDRFTMSVAASIPQAQAKALVIRWTRTKSLLARPIFLFGILSIAIGVLVGEPAHNAALGVAVTGGVAAVSFLQGSSYGLADQISFPAGRRQPAIRQS